jgi:hypothetical protein
MERILFEDVEGLFVASNQCGQSYSSKLKQMKKDPLRFKESNSEADIDRL